MFWLVLGLAIFVGGHLFTRQRGMRDRLVAAKGENFYRAVYSIVAIMGLFMIAHGFGAYRAAGYIQIWNPPRFFGHIAILLVWPAFILLVATYFPGRIKARAKHPMLLAVKMWATAHLLANGDLGSILLFGSFLAWAVYARIALKRAGGVENMPGAPEDGVSGRNDLIAIGVGTVLAFVFMFWLHRPLIGVGIFG
ncbi:MAG: NnrU family protein [Rhizobiales bacterium]|nr:NnrU family protein [Hyphomicrobiales bacterium]